jgi:parallel beta-helix repeat protein
MRRLRAGRLFGLALLALAIPACHDDQHSNFSLNIYVDPVFGDDFFGQGTPSFPLRTITRALHYTIAGDAIFLAPGTYSASSGEVFPIPVRPGVLIEGDPATKGVGAPATFVSGGGVYVISGGTQGGTTVTTAFVLGNGAQLSGVKITVTGAGGVGVVFDGSTGALSQCTITGCGASGVRVYQGASPTIVNNALTANAGSGVDVFDTGAPILRQNTISSNALDGVTANDSSVPNLGDASTAGSNTLQANTGVGLSNASTASTIQARGNTWTVSTQGSDASGNYAAALTAGPVAAVAGNNFAVTNAAAAIQF